MAEFEAKSARRDIDDTPPPPYSAAPHTGHFVILPVTSNSNFAQAHNHGQINPSNSITSAIRTRHRFPREFGIYVNNRFLSEDLAISYHADDPQILFYISIHSGFSGEPDIILRSSSHASSAPLATAELPYFPSTVPFKIYDSPNSIFDAQGTLSFISNMKFVVQLPGRSQREEFKWKSHKLVSCRTGETLAIWTETPFSFKKMGKLRFLAEDR
ncbi:hypothetical protein EPUL_006836, partial [Erysiphe pulchra]